jgi:hypothetical protein
MVGTVPVAMDDAVWALREFGDAALGDQRRTDCLVRIATAVGNRAHRSLPQACEDPALLKAAYRFFENDAVVPEAMVASHVQATWTRVQSVPLVIAAQDTTLLDYSAHPKTSGLGQIGNGRGRGLLAHTTLALTPERVSLGLLAQETWTRPEVPPTERVHRRKRPLAEKESQRWCSSLAAVNTARRACPETRFISVGDREADMYDLFVAAREPGVEVLVRAVRDRCLLTEQPPLRKLFAALAATPLGASTLVDVPARDGHPARQASLGVRWRAVTLRPPSRRAADRLPPVTLRAVWAVEQAPPPDVTPLAWLLLTTLPVETAAQALQVLDFYACRWTIEVFHKVLKSGCAIERRQLESVDHLQRCLALFSVVAWRILYATMLARSLPDLPATALLEASEWQALYCRIHHTTTLPPQVPTLAEVVRWIATLGGHLGRKSDGPPGVTVLWRGFQALAQLTAMYHVFRPPQPTFALPRNVGND